MSQLTKKLAVLEKRCKDMEELIALYQRTHEQQQKLIKSQEDAINMEKEMIRVLEERNELLESRIASLEEALHKVGSSLEAMEKAETEEQMKEAIMELIGKFGEDNDERNHESE